MLLTLDVLVLLGWEGRVRNVLSQVFAQFLHIARQQSNLQAT